MILGRSFLFNEEDVHNKGKRDENMSVPVRLFGQLERTFATGFLLGF